MVMSLEENHHQVKVSLPKGRTVPLGNLLWQVDAGLIPVLWNILRLVLTNWPLMESAFVGHDSCREHLQSCFNGDWVLMAQKSACSPVVGTRTFFAWILAMCKNMTLYCSPVENWQSGSKTLKGNVRLSRQRVAEEEEEVFPFLPPMSSRENKSRDEEDTRLGRVLHPAVLHCPVIPNSAFVLCFHLKTGFESDFPGCFYGKAAVVSGAVQEWKWD